MSNSDQKSKVGCGFHTNTCRRGCLHRAMVRDYHDQRDARDALRESEPYLQHEDEDFDAECPRVTFKMWLQGYWRSSESA